MEKDIKFSYSSSDLVKEPTSWEHSKKFPTPFDKKLTQAWDEAVKNGLFRYTLNEVSCRKIDLKTDGIYPLPCVAQLNPQRAVNRRKRECFESMNDAFNENQFNFTKIAKKEILMEIANEHSQNPNKPCAKILLNISPIDYGHVLIAPELESCLPEKLTQDSLLLAFDVLQLSSHPGFRLGFNSLHAWASINHLHFHAMYCDQEMFGDILPADRKVARSCYLLDESSPLPAFVFKIPDEHEERIKVAQDAVAITDYLHSISTPYNVVLNRGKILLKNGSQDSAWTTRILIFPRKSSKGLIPADPFDVACIEVGGHFPVKTQQSFDNITIDIILNTLKAAALSESDFDSILCNVKKILFDSVFFCWCDKSIKSRSLSLLS